MNKQKFIDLLNNEYNENNQISDIKNVVRENGYFVVTMKNGDVWLYFDDGTLIFDENINDY